MHTGCQVDLTPHKALHDTVTPLVLPLELYDALTATLSSMHNFALEVTPSASVFSDIVPEFLFPTQVPL